MEIIVNDTNIFIDLHSIGLLSQLCDLPYEIRTVDFVMAEIVDNRQQEDMGRLVKEGKITVESFTAEELIEIVNEHAAVSGNLPYRTARYAIMPVNIILLCLPATASYADMPSPIISLFTASFLYSMNLWHIRSFLRRWPQEN